MMEFRISWGREVNGTGLGSRPVMGCDIAKHSNCNTASKLEIREPTLSIVSPNTDF
jgi:hypothetical protein